MASYSNADLLEATRLLKDEFNKLSKLYKPTKIGESTCNANGFFKTYWEINNKLYYTRNNITN